MVFIFFIEISSVGACASVRWVDVRGKYEANVTGILAVCGVLDPIAREKGDGGAYGRGASGWD
jgi:hypothetical protein